MKKVLFFSSLLVFIMSPILMFAQPDLEEPINSASLPPDAAGICELPIWPDIYYYTNHFMIGQIVPEFTLFDKDDNEYSMSNLLSDGKPVLMVNGSFTCPVFRDKIELINILQDLYGDILNIVVIYTAEAHPSGDVSPYFGFEAPLDANIEEGILYPQPITYGQRKEMVLNLLDYAEINVPILIDGPCNEVWLGYGTYASNAYFIDTTGQVVDFHKWFSKYPDDIFVTLENYFGEEIVVSPDPEGDFAIESYPTECLTGDIGSTISAHINLVNVDTIDAWVNITKALETMPADWQTSLCTDVCYPPEVLSTSMIVPAGEEAYFILYFYTGGEAGEGEVKLYIEQSLNADLFYNATVKACTEEETTVYITGTDKPDFEVYPNPSDDWLRIESDEAANAQIRISSTTGQTMQTANMDNATTLVMDVSDLPSGIYLLEWESDHERSTELISIQ